VSESANRLAGAPSLPEFLRETATYSASLADAHAERGREYLRAIERKALTAGKFHDRRIRAG